MPNQFYVNLSDSDISNLNYVSTHYGPTLGITIEIVDGKKNSFWLGKVSTLKETQFLYSSKNLWMDGLELDKDHPVEINLIQLNSLFPHIIFNLSNIEK